MTTSSRRIPLVVTLLALAYSVLLTNPSLMAQEKLPKSWEKDSTLRSVFFVDHDSGWAVGDRGTILRTEDGGRNWNSISFPRDVIWSEVFFLNEKVGWIVGGHYRGSLDRSVGVMIRTIDGGKTWQNHSRNGIPFVRKIYFTDEQKGWLFCDSNPLHPSGLLATKDGGHQWRNAPGIANKKMKIARQLDQSATYVGIDDMNRWIQLDRTVEVGRTVPFDQPTELVQSGSLFVSTADGKLFEKSYRGKWKAAGTKVTASTVNWNAVSTRGEAVYVVGSPGHMIQHRVPGSTEWESQRTGQTGALHDVFFLDEQRGWAVGELGKILSTRDGGQTWTMQRNAESRVGVMHLVSSPEFISFSTISLLGGSFHHLCNVSILQSRLEPSSDQWKICQALNRAGNSSVDFIPVREANLLFHAVKTIRARRPSVIVIGHQDSVMKRWIRMVVDAAADQEKFKELTEGGLLPWQVQKVISVSESIPMDSSVALDRFSAQLGRTVALQSRFASQLYKRPQTVPQLSWSLISSAIRNSSVDQGMTSGTLAYDGVHCNRVRDQLQINNMQQFRSISNWNQSLERLSRERILSPLDEKVWAENVMASTSGMDKLSHAFFLSDLAQSYTRSGRPVMADYAERMILQNVPDTEVGEASLLKMIQRFGSVESNQFLNRVVQKRMEAARRGSSFDSRVQPASANLSLDPVRTVESAEQTVELIDVTPSSLQNATQLIDQFQSRFPDVAARPEVEFLIAQLKQVAGNRAAYERLLDSTSQLDFSSTMGTRLSREKKITKLDGVVVGSFQALDATKQRVMLDGRLSEKFWRSGSQNKKLKVAADQEYLYLAAQTKLENVPAVDRSRKRLRDESLIGFQRKKIFIDFDRDYSSGIEMTVDVRGACNDALWRDNHTRDISFDPTWYIASEIKGDVWTIEIAIPMDQLPCEPVTPASGWIVSTSDLKPHAREPESVETLLQRNRVLLFRQPH